MNVDNVEVNINYSHSNKCTFFGHTVVQRVSVFKQDYRYVDDFIENVDRKDIVAGHLKKKLILDTPIRTNDP